MRIRRPILCLVTSLLACGPGQPTTEPTSLASDTREPAPPESEPESEPESQLESQLESTIPDGCQVLLWIEADGANGRLVGPVMLTAKAKNLTDAPLELTLQDRCPGGAASFVGLEPPDGSYDYYGTCAMGACPGGRPPVVVALPPGEVVAISSADIHPDGDGPCQEPITAGIYRSTFTLPLDGSSNPALCGPEPLELRRE